MAVVVGGTRERRLFGIRNPFLPVRRRCNPRPRLAMTAWTGGGEGRRREAAGPVSKFEDVSPSIKLPWTRERRPSLPLVARL